jgi:hypothetical protein
MRLRIGGKEKERRMKKLENKKKNFPRKDKDRTRGKDYKYKRAG